MLRKEKKKMKKKLKEQMKMDKKKIKDAKTCDDLFDVPIQLMDRSKNLAPMTKEEWEKKQSVVRRVYDEATGRNRYMINVIIEFSLSKSYFMKLCMFDTKFLRVKSIWHTWRVEHIHFSEDLICLYFTINFNIKYVILFT